MANRFREPDYYSKAMEFCRIRREEIGLTQAAVAERVGVSKDTYWRWEKGSATPSDGQLKKLLKIVDSTQEQLDAYLLEKGASDVFIPTSEASEIETTRPEQSDLDPCRSEGPVDGPSIVAPSLAPREDKPAPEVHADFPTTDCSATPTAPPPVRKRIPPVAILTLVVGYLVGVAQGAWLSRLSPQRAVPMGTATSRFAAGQGSSRRELFESCYAAHRDKLGGPTGAVFRAAPSARGEAGECQRFVDGVIYLPDHNDRAFAVSGSKARAHEQVGGVSGSHSLGFPRSDVELAAASHVNGRTAGTLQRFEQGSVYESSYGTFPVVGAMSREHESRRGTDGTMGFPKGIPQRHNGRIIQEFEGGRVSVATTD
jgi:transcriptional regulator with XRE-family HTH domain